MGKRFTETEKWRDKWFRSLSPEYKLAWNYLCDNCDAAGVIELDEEMANFQIGGEVDWEDFVDNVSKRDVPEDGRKFAERIMRLPCGKLWITDFIRFQYPTGVSDSSNAHGPIRSSIERYDLPVGENETLSRGFKGSKETDNIPGRPQDMDKDKDKDKGKDTDKGSGKGSSRSGEQLDDVPGPELSKTELTPAVDRVIERYRHHHPRARPGDRERRKILDRLNDGFSVGDLRLAIDGCHKSPYHCGENDSGTLYQALELIVRDGDKVTKFLEIASQVNGNGHHKQAGPSKDPRLRLESARSILVKRGVLGSRDWNIDEHGDKIQSAYNELFAADAG